MDLDGTAERRKKNNSRNKKIRGNCYNYGKEGYFAKNCRKEKKPQQDAKEIQVMLEFLKINYNNKQVEDSQGKD
jgi:hypothetical protein